MATRIQYTDNPVRTNIAIRATLTKTPSQYDNLLPIPVYRVKPEELVEQGGFFELGANDPANFIVFETEGENILNQSAIPIYIEREI